MWCYSIANIFLTVLLVNIHIHSCYCHVPLLKGETRNDVDLTEKGQSVFEEYSSTELEIETTLKDKETETRYPIINKKKSVIINSTYSNKSQENINKSIYVWNKGPSAAGTQVVKSGEISDTSTISENSAESSEKSVEFSEISTNVNEDNASSYNEPKRSGTSDVDNPCDKFKTPIELDARKMADVWKIAYYTVPDHLKCFKLHIRKVTSDEQEFYYRKYGNYEDRIIWSKCELEIKSNDVNSTVNVTRKHFLQNMGVGSGVMQNIIIEEEIFENTTSLTLMEEVSDQWMVIKNLLLMRDCDSGDLVIFTRVPWEPKMRDIEHALQVFGETSMNIGTKAC